MQSRVKVVGLTKEFWVRRQAPPGQLRSLRGWLRPQRERRVAIQGISFELAAGELVGYLGPNGSGKSTTLKVLSGILVPTAGEVLVDGRVPWKDRVTHVARIGAVFGHRTSLWWDLPVLDSLLLARKMYGLTKAEFDRSMDELVQELDLAPLLQVPVRELSLGQRMRAELCHGLIHRPGVLFLDEPTLGIDLLAKDRIRSFLSRKRRASQTTVLLTTHDLDDVEALCDRVIVLDQGEVLFDGSLDALRKQSGGRTEVTLELGSEVRPRLEGAELLHAEGHFVTYSADLTRTSVQSLMLGLTSLQVRNITIKPVGVEQIIRELYTSRKRGPHE